MKKKSEGPRNTFSDLLTLKTSPSYHHLSHLSVAKYRKSRGKNVKREDASLPPLFSVHQRVEKKNYYSCGSHQNLCTIQPFPSNFSFQPNKRKILLSFLFPSSLFLSFLNHSYQTHPKRVIVLAIKFRCRSL